MRGILFLGIMICLSHTIFPQRIVRGTIADSITRQGLAFATIKPEGKATGIIAGIHGNFSAKLPPGSERIVVSYAGYATRLFPIYKLNQGDTIFLVAVNATLGEVIIRPNSEKIRRIIYSAIRNKSIHNPDQYDFYKCHIYYKMTTDLVPSKSFLDSALARRRRDTTEQDLDLLSGENHLLFSEVYSIRSYTKPQQVQELVLASRFSGLRKTYFTNLVTDVLPFHVYSDYIALNGKDYSNPIARGWSSRYRFRIEDEITEADDTTFILSFEPKNTSFNGLKGRVYINSNGYAISHFSGLTTDAVDRNVKIEQIYHFEKGKWFPRELNYEFIFHKYPLPDLGLRMRGNSLIDSVSFVKPEGYRVDKAYPVKFGDSIDLHSEEKWQELRPDTITQKEKNTYRVMDSLSEKANVEKLVYKIGRFALGLFPVGNWDIDVKRLLATNELEGLRLGTGLYSNDKLSRFFSMGGWFGYGFKDKVLKYGSSFILYPRGEKDNWLGIFYQKNYQVQGGIRIHPELDRTGFRNWILNRADRIEEILLKAHTQRGYWQIELGAMKQLLTPVFQNNFDPGTGAITSFHSQEATIGLRYAYGEKRIPSFDYYLPTPTKYPIFYLKAALGKTWADKYRVNFLRFLGAMTYKKHINRWGNDQFRFEGGWIHAFENKPLAPSYLLSGNGFRTDGLNYYAWGGFLTMKPFDFYSERYISLLYRHDFDRFLWDTKLSKPFLSLAHNLVYGTISLDSRLANPGLRTPVSGYHESGLLVNQLFQKNILHAFNLYINAGLFAHWHSNLSWKKDAVWVIGISAGL